MKKLFSLLTLTLLLCSTVSGADWPVAWGISTKDFKSDATSNYTGTSSNNTYFSKDGKIMFRSQGSGMSISTDNGMGLGSSSNPGALVFYVDQASNITVTVRRYGYDTTIKLDYLGSTKPDNLSSSNITTAGTSCDSESITSSNTPATLTKNSGESGYYKIYSSKRFYIESITVTAANVAPSFTAPTVDQSVSYEVDEVVASPLSVTATGTPAPTLQWYSNTSATTAGATTLTGNTNSTYTPSTAAESDLYFYCVAENSLGTATSPFFHVTVTDPICPDGISISGTKEYYVGDDIELTAALEAGNGAITYQWYKDGLEDANELDGETSSTLTIASCALGDAGSYYCVASKKDCADAVSAAFPVSVIAVPSNGVLFSIQFVNTSAVTMDDGETKTLTSSDATIVGGSASIKYFNSGKTGQTVINSSKKMNYGTNNMYLKLVLDEALQPGDVINIADGSGKQIAIAATDGAPKDQTKKQTTSSYKYTVVKDDNLDGMSTLYLGRADGSSTTHGKVTITRPYTRSELTSGNWGTICLPYAVASGDYAGATFYSIAGKRVNGIGDPSSIVLSEEDGALVAGRPYIFQATANILSAFYSGDVASAGSNNGLIGSIGGTSVAQGMYLLSSGTIVKAGTGCSITANRAYINMASVPVYDGGGSAPGIREIPMAPTTPTSVENVNSAEKAVKFVENGQILILRDGITYDIMGRVIR